MTKKLLFALALSPAAYAAAELHLTFHNTARYERPGAVVVEHQGSIPLEAQSAKICGSAENPVTDAVLYTCCVKKQTEIKSLR